MKTDFWGRFSTTLLVYTAIDIIMQLMVFLGRNEPLNTEFLWQVFFSWCVGSIIIVAFSYYTREEL